jgi:hypothetical protein
VFQMIEFTKSSSRNKIPLKITSRRDEFLLMPCDGCECEMIRFDWICEDCWKNSLGFVRNDKVNCLLISEQVSVCRR